MNSLSQRPRPVAYSRFAAEVLDLYRPPLRRRATFLKMRQSLREFGELAGEGASTADITCGLLGRWVAAHAGRRPQTNAGMLRPFQAACGYARKMGYLRVSPFDIRKDWIAIDADADADDRAPKHRSIAQIAAILDLVATEATGGDWEAQRLQVLVCLYAYTGMRKSEVLGLRPADVDLEHKLIVLRSRKQRRLKTRASAGVVGIPDELAAVLGPWLRRCGPDWLIPGIRKRDLPWTGGMPGSKPLDKIKAAAARAGVEGMTIHAFRHSIATAAGRLGLSPLELKAQLRHTSLGTQVHYLGSDADNARAVARRITYNVPPGTR